MISWRQGSTWHLHSTCGRYTVSKAIVAGKPAYTPWLICAGAPALPLGTFDTAEAAKAHAEKHAQDAA